QSLMETARPTPTDETHGARASNQTGRSKRSLPGRVAFNEHPVPQAHDKRHREFQFCSESTEAENSPPQGRSLPASDKPPGARSSSTVAILYPASRNRSGLS